MAAPSYCPDQRPFGSKKSGGSPARLLSGPAFGASERRAAACPRATRSVGPGDGAVAHRVFFVVLPRPAQVGTRSPEMHIMRTLKLLALAPFALAIACGGSDQTPPATPSTPGDDGGAAATAPADTTAPAASAAPADTAAAAAPTPPPADTTPAVVDAGPPPDAVVDAGPPAK